MRVLVVDDTDVMRQIMVTVLERQFKATVVEASSGNEAIDAIKADPIFDCVVCDYAMPNGSGGDVYNYIKSSGHNIPYIFCSTRKIEDCDEFKDQEIFGVVEKAKIIPSLTRVMNALLKNDEFQVGAFTHCRVKPIVLEKLGTAPCDIYLKISSIKYVRLINRRDQVEEDLLRKYEKKGMEYFYLRHVDSAAFLDALVSYAMSMQGLNQAPRTPEEIKEMAEAVKDDEIRKSILEILQKMQEVDAKSMDLPAALRVSDEVNEKIQNAVSQIGITKETQLLIQANVQFTLQSLARNPTLMELFEKADMDRDRFLISHSALLAYVSCSLASILGWNSDFTRYKLCLGSFLHDLSIADIPFARLESVEELLFRADAFTEKQVDSFLRHPSASTAIALNMSDLPPDVEQLVAQHHERPDGTGFPHRLNHTKLGTLASLFIMAHDLVGYVFDHSSQKWSFRDFVIKSGSTYEQGHFRKLKAKLIS